MRIQIYRSLRCHVATANGALYRTAHTACALLLVGWLLLLHTSFAWAQRDGNRENPFENFSDPEFLFQQFFGGDSDEDRATIQKISISSREEQQIGKRGIDAYLAGLRRQKIKVVIRGKDVEYLQQLIAQLHPLMENHARYRSVRVYVVQSDKVDARSFPGGNLVFFRGLLDLVENEAALVGVIGHELSHLDRGHQLYDAKRAKLMQETFTGANGFSPEQFFKNGAMLMRSFTRPFRPEEEAEADQDGVRWSYATGYDPREFAKLLLRMNDRDDPRGNHVPEFLRTHPFNLDRYDAVIDQYEQLQAERPTAKLYIGRQNLGRRIPRAEKEFEE